MVHVSEIAFHTVPDHISYTTLHQWLMAYSHGGDADEEESAGGMEVDEDISVTHEIQLPHLAHRALTQAFGLPNVSFSEPHQDAMLLSYPQTPMRLAPYYPGVDYGHYDPSRATDMPVALEVVGRRNNHESDRHEFLARMNAHMDAYYTSDTRSDAPMRTSKRTRDVLSEDTTMDDSGRHARPLADMDLC